MAKFNSGGYKTIQVIEIKYKAKGGAPDLNRVVEKSHINQRTQKKISTQLESQQGSVAHTQMFLDKEGGPLFNLPADLSPGEALVVAQQLSSDGWIAIHHMMSHTFRKITSLKLVTEAAKGGIVLKITRKNFIVMPTPKGKALAPKGSLASNMYPHGGRHTEEGHSIVLRMLERAEKKLIEAKMFNPENAKKALLDLLPDIRRKLHNAEINLYAKKPQPL